MNRLCRKPLNEEESRFMEKILASDGTAGEKFLDVGGIHQRGGQLVLSLCF